MPLHIPYLDPSRPLTLTSFALVIPNVNPVEKTKGATAQAHELKHTLPHSGVASPAPVPQNVTDVVDFQGPQPTLPTIEYAAAG